MSRGTRSLGPTLMFGFLFVIGWSPVGLSSETETARVAETTTENLFQPILRTIQHPRCLNCHTSTNFPRQNDSRHRHSMNVVREQNEIGMQCSACHGTENNDVGGVPGAPHWGLAPLSMAWEYMTPQQICVQLKDPLRNGGKSIDALHSHLIEDALVLWAWNPGRHPDGSSRTHPPLELAAWKKAVHEWVSANAPCPEDVTGTEESQ